MSNTKNDKEFFMLAKNHGGFTDCLPKDDLLHPEDNAACSADTLTETQYFGLNIPEENIHGLCYLWHHPNLGIVTGGVWIWQGIKSNHLSAELHDMRSFMSDRVLENDLHKFTLDNGYGVEILEPLKRFRATYSDVSRDNSLDVTYTALMPPVKFGDGMHFEQAMKAEGTLTLRGKTYQVNSRTIRDRSWGTPRPEDNMPLPPVSWVNAAFGDDFFVNLIAFDHPDTNPVWKDHFDFSADMAFKAGWVYRDGKLQEIISCVKKTSHDAQTWLPTHVDMDLVLANGEALKVSGEMIAASHWSAWINSDVALCLAKWRCEGKTGYGDVQEARWNDHLYKLASKK